MNLFELTRKLIEIKSITGEEAEIIGFLSEYLNGRGFDIRLIPVNGERSNILAFKGEPRVILSTHTDTVLPYIPYSEDDSYFYGRGACDTKGIIASQIKASEMLLSGGFTNFGLLFVVGEESISDGAISANKIENNCRWLVNGEPTENKMAIGSKGSLRVKLTVKGKAAHAAYPEHGESAIEKLLDIFNDIRKEYFPKHELLGATTYNIGTISGGIQANVIPPFAESLLMFRIVSSVADVKQILEKIVNKRAKLEYIFECEPVLTKTLPGYETMVASYTTDIPNLNNWGKPVLFGPGSILDAHTNHEKISKKELADAVELYYEIVKKLLLEA
ncbi:MAG: M20/M25/M40 family metallo-hydrolase [Calditrichaceae bacterium]